MLFKVALGALGLSIAFNAFLIGSNQKIRAELTETRLNLGACSERIVNIKEDAKDDGKIDNISDLSDFDIPADWMLPEPTGD